MTNYLSDLVISIGSFLLGVLTAWYKNRSRISKIEDDLAVLVQDISALLEQVNASETKK